MKKRLMIDDQLIARILKSHDREPTSLATKWVGSHERRDDRIDAHIYYVRILPYGMYPTPLPRGYLEFRPWPTSPNGQRYRMVLSLR